jgi:helix-turn-helix protein
MANENEEEIKPEEVTIFDAMGVESMLEKEKEEFKERVINRLIEKAKDLRRITMSREGREVVSKIINNVEEAF